MHHILLADDDSDLTELLKQYLETEGFRVDTAADGAEALRLASNESFDLMVLDVMMPALNGFNVLRELRRASQLPVLLLTARGDDLDSIIGLEIGADDYLPKPCNPRVLVARIQAILRRSRDPAATESTGHSQGQVLTVGDIEMHRGRRSITRGNTEIAMTSTEYNVLELLLLHAGAMVTKNELYRHALGREQTHYDRSIDMHISRLGNKLGPLPDGVERIKTVRGQGYQYVIS